MRDVRKEGGVPEDAHRVAGQSRRDEEGERLALPARCERSHVRGQPAASPAGERLRVAAVCCQEEEEEEEGGQRLPLARTSSPTNAELPPLKTGQELARREAYGGCLGRQCGGWRLNTCSPLHVALGDWGRHALDLTSRFASPSSFGTPSATLTAIAERTTHVPHGRTGGRSPRVARGPLRQARPRVPVLSPLAAPAIPVPQPHGVRTEGTTM